MSSAVFVWVFAVGASARLSLTTAGVFLILGTIGELLKSREVRGSVPDVFLDVLTALFVISFGVVMFQSHSDFIRKLPITVVTICLVLVSLRGVKTNIVTSADRSHTFSVVMLISPLLIISLRGFVPLLVLAVCAGFALYVWRRFDGLVSRILGVVIIILGVGVSRRWALGEPFWFWLTFDQLFRASLSTGLTRWGYTDLNSAAGLTLNYHWLAEGVTGLVSRLGASDEYLVVTRVSPILFMTGCFLAMWQLVRLSGVRRDSAIVGCVLVSLILLEMDPYSIGTLAGAALTCRLLVVVGSAGLSAIRIQIFAVLLSFLLLMTQTPFGIVMIGTVVLLAIQQWWNSEIRLSVLGFLMATFIALPFALRLTLLKPGDGIETAGSLGLRNLLQFRGFNVPFGIDALSPSWLRNLNSVSFLVELAVMIAPALILLLHRTGSHGRSLLSSHLSRTAVALCVASLCLVNLIQIGVAQGKLFSAILLSLLPISMSFGWELAGNGRYRLAILAVVLGSLAAATYRFVRNLNSDVVAATASIGFVAMALLLFALWLWKAEFGNQQQFSLQSRRLRSLFLALPLALVLGLSAGRHDRVLGYLNRSPVSEEIMIGSESTRACLDWIRANTVESAVIGTNIFDPISLPSSEKSYLVSAWTKRRVFIDGLYNSRRYFEAETVRRVNMIGAPRELPEIVQFLILNNQGPATEALRGLFELRLARQDCRVLERING